MFKLSFKKRYILNLLHDGLDFKRSTHSLIEIHTGEHFYTDLNCIFKFDYFSFVKCYHPSLISYDIFGDALIAETLF